MLRSFAACHEQSPVEKSTDTIYPQPFSQSVAITPDCNKVVCGSMDGSVVLFDIEKKQAIQKYQVSLSLARTRDNGLTEDAQVT